MRGGRENGGLRPERDWKEGVGFVRTAGCSDAGGQVHDA